MITLRFTQPYGVFTPPFNIRFGDNTPPTPEIEWLAVEAAVAWRTLPALANQTRANWHSKSIGNAASLRFALADTSEIQCNLAQHNNPPALSARTLLSWHKGKAITNNTVLAFTLTSRIIEKQTRSRWQTTMQRVNGETALPWQSVMPLVRLDKPLHWRVNPELNSQAFIFYYGTAAAKWICIWQDHPIAGYVIANFTAPATTSTATFNIRFSPPKKACYWGAVGLIRASDDVPTLERKVTIEPPVRRAYIMQPTITCERTRDNKTIVINSVNYQHSRSQFAATGSIVFNSRIDYERALNEELKLSLNGYLFFIKVEQPQSTAVFAKRTYSASFRSRFAELSAPYARKTNYTNANPRTLAGIMSDILLNSGWTLDNKMIDYPVPAGAFSYVNLAPAQALLEVAKSVGAILTFDETLRKVAVVPKWPVMPWDTENATPDIILHDAVILSANDTRTISPECNVIFVRGEQEGVACKVKQRDTLADKYADDIVDPLITDVNAARQRGSSELADTGDKIQTTLSCKIMPELPPIKVGQLVGVRSGATLHKATCDSISISANVNAKGAISINQTAKVLRNV